MNRVLGIDIGGSHITTAGVDLEKRVLLQHSLHRARVNAHGTAEQIIAAWCREIESSYASLEPTHKNVRNNWQIGIAMPGPFDYDGGISLIKGFNKYDALYELNIKSLMADKLNILPEQILLKNDAACFLDGELFAGAGYNYAQVLGLTLGTGFGSAYGTDGIAVDAQLWQTPFGDSRAEDYFSTKWFIQQAYEKEGIRIHGVKDLIDVPSHKKLSEDLFAIFSQNLAEFFEAYLSKNNYPQRVILGGNIAQAKELYWNKLQRHLDQRNIQLNIAISKLGENAAILGAASLWKHQNASIQQ